MVFSWFGEDVSRFPCHCENAPVPRIMDPEPTHSLQPVHLPS